MVFPELFLEINGMCVPCMCTHFLSRFYSAVYMVYSTIIHVQKQSHGLLLLHVYSFPEFLSMVNVYLPSFGQSRDLEAILDTSFIFSTLPLPLPNLIH